MKLGNRVQFVYGVSSLAEASAFFDALEMERIASAETPYPWAQYSDGQHLFLLNEDGMIYRGLIYFQPALDTVVNSMEAEGIDFFHKQADDGGTLSSAMFIDPNGKDGINGDRNLGVNIVRHEPDGLHTPDGKPLSLCGKFGEFATPVTELHAAVAYWGKLGFTPSFTNEEPYPWGILLDGLVVLGLHQVTEDEALDFDTASLTYFNPDSAERIAAIKANGITPAFEMPNADGVVDNAGFVFSGGHNIFLFNGEI